MTDNPKPLVFISHKHINKAIADIMRQFIISSTGGNVEVFQSSSEQATGRTPDST